MSSRCIPDARSPANRGLRTFDNFFLGQRARNHLPRIDTRAGARGHNVTFLEREFPGIATTAIYHILPFCNYICTKLSRELKDKYLPLIRQADVTIVGSYVPDGVAVGDWVIENGCGLKVFYDIDTPVTLSKMASGDYEYLTPRLVPKYDLYLSFTGGPVLSRIESELGSPCAEALYCSVDPELYFPEASELVWNLGYLGTYSVDRQPMLDALLYSRHARTKI